MYDYPNASDIGGLLSYPTYASPNFWFWIIGGLWTIITLTLYYKEVSLFGKGKFLSSMVVGGFFSMALSVIGSTIGFISVEILIYIVVLFAIFTAIWLFSSDKT